jgi:triosephosphate isomerase
MRKALIAANWKMHKTLDEAVSFTEALQRETGAVEDREVVIAPPFTALVGVRHVMNQKGFKLAAQNCHFEGKGAFTGEISTVMLKDTGCDYVILGHSERRHIFGETDEMIQKKVKAVFDGGLLPILCVGEVLEDRKGGRTMDVIGSQLDKAGAGLTPDQAERLVIAYEPVWAIGTGLTATPQQAQEVHAFIRDRYASIHDKVVAKAIRIVYGGSVKPDNVDSLMTEPDIDGMLVGGASLEVASFKRIIQYKSLEK